MDIRLYGATVSYPSAAARLMLEHKRLPYTWVRLIPGTHALLPLAGFPGATVPALKVDGRRVTGSAQIARVLDELRPEPALLPADPGRRRAVEEAEAWGDAVLQPIPRRLLRWAIRHDADARVTVARILGTSRPELVGRLVIPPVAVLLARRENAGSTDRIAADWAALPAHLDHAEQLIADGVLGADQPTAADFQIGATLRAMLDFEDYAPLVRGRRLEDLARRVMPDHPFRWPPLMPLVSARSARARGTRGCASSRTRSARSTARPAAPA